MRTILLIIICFIASQMAYAQNNKSVGRFGVRAGISSTSIKVSNIVNWQRGDTSSTRFVNGDERIGFHLGLWGRFKVGKHTHLQPEVLFSALGGNVILRDLVNQQPQQTVAKINLNRMDFNLLYGYKLGPLRAQIGPTVNWVFNRDQGLRDFKSRYKSYTVGFLAGLGLDIGKIGLDVRYEGNLSKLGDTIYGSDGRAHRFNQRASQLIASLALSF